LVFIDLYLDISGNGLAWRVKFGINPGTHEACTGGSASNKVNPDRRPTVSVLKGANSQKSSRGSERPTPID